MSGWKEINRHVKCLESNHFQDMMVYGSNRAQNHSKVAVCQPFSWAIEGRNASLRIPHSTLANKRGYYEDRRPAANMDPYLVSSPSVLSKFRILQSCTNREGHHDSLCSINNMLSTAKLRRRRPPPS